MLTLLTSHTRNEWYIRDTIDKTNCVKSARLSEPHSRSTTCNSRREKVTRCFSASGNSLFSLRGRTARWFRLGRGNCEGTLPPFLPPRQRRCNWRRNCGFITAIKEIRIAQVRRGKRSRNRVLPAAVCERYENRYTLVPDSPYVESLTNYKLKKKTYAT